MKRVPPPTSELLVDLPLPLSDRYAGTITALASLRDEAEAQVDRLLASPDETDDDSAAITTVAQQQSINLIAADAWLQNSELAGMPVVQMRGDSMGATFRDGDFVLVETDDTDVAYGGIFAILENQSVIITQVEMIYQSGYSTGRIKCTPRNPAYAPFELTLGKDAKIIGRVARRITRYL
jgi:hypothetical protein